MGFRKRWDEMKQELTRLNASEGAFSHGIHRLNEKTASLSKFQAMLTDRVAALERKLEELEPELERYKQDAEEAAEYEKRRNDGMEAIFGYMTPGMRGGENG